MSLDVRAVFFDKFVNHKFILFLMHISFPIKMYLTAHAFVISVLNSNSLLLLVVVVCLFVFFVYFGF